MKRLRHPIRAIREPFGTAGLVVACVALIAALGGTAFAAAKLNSTQKKEVEKIAKKYAGKPGAPGAAGPQGPAGPAGAKGDPGAKGDKGDAGTSGAAGKSVVAANEPEGANCEAGGTKFEVEGSGVKHYACNGEQGEPGEKGDKGEKGDPWTAGGTLPAGATETGYWTASGSGEVLAPLSYAIPLAGNLTGENALYGTGEEPPIEVSPGVTEPTEFRKRCPTTAANPTVAAGNDRTLCVYIFPNQSAPATFISITRNVEPEGTSRAGGILRVNITGSGTVYGAFAVSGG